MNLKFYIIVIASPDV